MWGRRQPGNPKRNMGQRNMSIEVEQRNNQAIQRQNSLEKKPPQTSLSYQHAQQRLGGIMNDHSLQGINSTPYRFTITSMGNVQGTALFILDISTIGVGQRAILSITGFRTMLLNYAASDFPAIYSLTSPEIDGQYDQNTQLTNIIATSSIYGGVSTTVNPGGVIGYNINYQQTTKDITWDISTITSLTFNLLSGIEKSPVTYPTASEFIVQFTVTKIMI